MKDTIEILISADSLLDTISVKGGDVFQLARARTMLKEVFDALRTPTPEVNDDGR